jgi:hypothetical protein
MYSGDDYYEGDITSGEYSEAYDRQEMIDALYATGEFTMELLNILDNEELAELCDEYGV